MPTVRTFTKPPLSDSVIVKIPKELQSYALEIIVLPAVQQEQGYFADQVHYEPEIQRDDDAEWQAKFDALVHKTKFDDDKPYKFNRADAYPEGEYA